MKNNQDGFVASLLLTIGVLLALGVVTYFYVKTNNEVSTKKQVDEMKINEAQSTPAINSVIVSTSTKITNSVKVIPPAPKFSIVYPNGGENIKIGDSVNVTWQNSPTSAKEKIKIYLVKDNSGCFSTKQNSQPCLPVVDSEEVVANNIPNTGNYSWTAENKGNYYMRICTVEGHNLCDESDGLFTVFDPVEAADMPPVINSVTGPKSLRINEEGIWTIDASDPEGQKILYSMSVTKVSPTSVTPYKIVGIKPADAYSSLIKYKFDQAGTYEVQFVASDFYGKMGTSDMTVDVQ